MSLTEKEKEFLKQFGNTLRLKRAELGLSQEALSEKADCHVNTIGKLERGTLDVSFITALKIIDALEMAFQVYNLFQEDEEECSLTDFRIP